MVDSKRKRRRAPAQASHSRDFNYRQIKNNFIKQTVFSKDRLEAVHRESLKVLAELGIKVLNPEARDLFIKNGSECKEAENLILIQPEHVEEALESAPASFTLHGGIPRHNCIIGDDNLVFAPVGGPPHISDLDQGKRPGTLEEAKNFFKLVEHFDILQIHTANVEPQDSPVNLRHLYVTEAQLSSGHKPPFIYARGASQVQDCLKMVKIARNLSDEAFLATPCCYTVINTNSPRILDDSMCQGILDLARAGQPSFITPFTLSGAMAPVTIAGALVLQHAEALAGIVLSQLARKGAPVVYGSFTSNVDMKSGSPAFGTPEAVKASIGAGQLARHIGLPWRGSAGTASNIADGQAVYETQLSVWGALLGGANVVFHSAGWLEGGLTASKEKLILDIETLQMLAETLAPLNSEDTELAFEAIKQTEPGGHFFSSDHTLERYKTAFYEPNLSDWRNFGQWNEDGGKRAVERANQIWKDILENYEMPESCKEIHYNLNQFVEKRVSEGGAFPESL